MGLQSPKVVSDRQETATAAQDGEEQYRPQGQSLTILIVIYLDGFNHFDAFPLPYIHACVCVCVMCGSSLLLLLLLSRSFVLGRATQAQFSYHRLQLDFVGFVMKPKFSLFFIPLVLFSRFNNKNKRFSYHTYDLHQSWGTCDREGERERENNIWIIR